jgi:monofunctional biosynthetic peptidoglycan transglycosylase
LKKIKNLIILSILAVVVVLAGFAAFLHFQMPYGEIDKLASHYIAIEEVDDVGRASFKIVREKPSNWVTLKQVPRHFLDSLIVSEDWSYFSHQGVDWAELQKALLEGVTKGKLRGASTITQQVVKNIFLTREKTVIRKMKEMAMAMYLERKVKKQKILELYINLIELGDGLYGVHDASLYYFRKNPAGLSIRESAFLVMLLPSPIKYSSSYHDKKLSPYANKIMRSIFDKLKARRFITEEQWEDALSEIMNFERTTPKSSGARPSEGSIKRNNAKRHDGRDMERAAFSDNSLEVGDEPSEEDIDSLGNDDLSVEDAEFSVE